MGTTCQSTIRQFTDPVSLAPYCLRRVWDATPNPTGEGDADRDPWRILLAQYTLPGRDLFTGGLAVRRHRGGRRRSRLNNPFPPALVNTEVRREQLIPPRWRTTAKIGRAHV